VACFLFSVPCVEALMACIQMVTLHTAYNRLDGRLSGDMQCREYPLSIIYIQKHSIYMMIDGALQGLMQEGQNINSG